MINVLRDLERGATLQGDTVPYSLPNSVRKDFYSRVRSRGVAARTFRHDLYEMLAGAIVTRTPPDWVRRRDADAWLVAGDLACPLRWEHDELRVLTVLRAPSAVSPVRRGTSGCTAGAGRAPAVPGQPVSNERT